jgi:dihydrofolate reductase
VIVSLLVAMDEQRGIGWANRLPWRLPDDLKRFKTLTMGHHLLMGRKTFESIGRPLPGRTTIVITRNPDYQPDNCQPEDCFIAYSLSKALSLAADRGETESFVIGGGEIFAQALELADRMYQTLVHTTGSADVFFPAYEPDDWIVKETVYQPAGECNEFPYTFNLLERKR